MDHSPGVSQGQGEITAVLCAARVQFQSNAQLEIETSPVLQRDRAERLDLELPNLKAKT